MEDRLVELPIQPYPGEHPDDFITRVNQMSQRMNHSGNMQSCVVIQREAGGTLRAVMRIHMPAVLVDPHLIRRSSGQLEQSGAQEYVDLQNLIAPDC